MIEPENGNWLFLFKSYAELCRDVRTWCMHLPPLSAVGGLPRSGLMVATLISLYRNIPLVSRKPYRSREQDIQGDILIVDWTPHGLGRVSRGYAQYQDQAKDPRIKYGCYLCHERCVQMFDYVFLNTGKR